MNLSNAHEGVSWSKESRDQAMKAYDRMSSWYDFIAGNSERKLAEAGLKELGVNEGESVLEIDFGTGNILLDLAEIAGNSGNFGYMTEDLFGLPEISGNISKADVSSLKQIEAIISRYNTDYQLRKGICLIDEYGVPNQDLFSFEVRSIVEVAELLVVCRCAFSDSHISGDGSFSGFFVRLVGDGDFLSPAFVDSDA